MADTKCTNPRLEPAENGFIMTWNEAEKSNKDGTYGEYGYGQSKTKVFEKESSDTIMKEFSALCKKCGFAMNSNSMDEEESED